MPITGLWGGTWTHILPPMRPSEARRFRHIVRPVETALPVPEPILAANRKYADTSRLAQTIVHTTHELAAWDGAAAVMVQDLQRTYADDGCVATPIVTVLPATYWQ
jgi:hypothetical protein